MPIQKETVLGYSAKTMVIIRTVAIKHSSFICECSAIGKVIHPSSEMNTMGTTNPYWWSFF